MDIQILIQYGIVLLSLILLEGLLSADNAIVLAIMVRHLEIKKQKKALLYGLVGALFFRVIAIFLITTLAKYWEIQIIGGIYLLYMSITHIRDFYKKLKSKNIKNIKEGKNKSGFLMTIVKVELTDIAFAIDSILASVAIAITLPHLSETEIGNINLGQFVVMVLGGMIGVVIMRFAANLFIRILDRKPGLELSAFLIVAWVGIKLFIISFAHENLALIPKEFPHSITWNVIFWTVLIFILIIGYFCSESLNKKIQNKI